MSRSLSVDVIRRIRGWLLARNPQRVVLQTIVSGRAVYRTPSDSRPGIGYDQFVDEDGVLVCTCADFSARHRPCKHIVEVLYRFFPSLAPPEPTAEELGRLVPGEMYAGARRFKKLPFEYQAGLAESTRRDHALQSEGARFESLLLDLACVLNERHPQRAAHRHTLPAGDKVLALVLRHYHRKSLRAARALLEPFAASGRIAFAPKKNTLITYLQARETRQFLQEALALTIAPFCIMEQDILVDASSISPFYFESWRAIAYGDHKSPATKWFRIHAAIGRLSHALLGFSLTPSTGDGTGDSTHLSGLLDDVQRAGIDLRYVIADNGYLIPLQVSEVLRRGATLIAPLKGRNRNRAGQITDGLQSVSTFAEQHPELYDELLRARQPIEGFFSLEKRRDNRLASIGTAEERQDTRRGLHDGLFVARVNEFFIRMIRYNLTRINVEEHLRDRRISFSTGSRFSHVREMVEVDYGT